MFLELVDSLRCLRPHEDTWLVAAVDRFEGRYIVEGSLGCPVCNARYPIAGGVVDFAPTLADRDLAPREPRRVLPPSESDVLRAAALLDLREPGGIVVLAGASARLADGLDDRIAINLILLDAPADLPIGSGRSVLRAPDALPFAPGCVRGLVLDGSTATSGRLAGAARVLRPRGRLVAPAHVPVPPGIEELARDDEEWVGVRSSAVAEPVTIERRHARP